MSLIKEPSKNESVNQLTSDGTNTYTWDRANRPLSFGGIDYAYNGLGQRLSQDNGIVVTKYLLDVQPGLAQVLASRVDTDVTRYIYGPRGIHSQQNPNDDWLWMAQDGLGTVRGIYDDGLSLEESHQPTDAARIAAIYNEGIQSHMATFETRLRSIDDILAWFDDGHYPILIAKKDEEVIGWIAASSYRNRECYAGIAEFSVYIATHAQGNGMGRCLLAAFISVCEERDFWKLIS